MSATKSIASTASALSSPPVAGRPSVSKVTRSENLTIFGLPVRKLKGYTLKCIFIREDLSLEDHHIRKENARVRKPSVTYVGSVQVEVSTLSQVQSPSAFKSTFCQDS